MPKPEWSFFMLPEDHKEVKWSLSYLRAKFTPWGQTIFGMAFVGMAISSVGTETSAYFFVSLVFALFFASLMLSSFFKPTVTVTFHQPHPITAGGFYLCQVTLTNVGRRPLRNIELFLHKLPYGLYENPNHPDNKSDVSWLGINEHITLTLNLRTPRRGSFVIKPLLVGTSFPSGLLRAVFNTRRDTPFIVLPKLLRTPEIFMPFKDRSNSKPSQGGAAHGNSNEFLSTRDYRHGDRPRDIHWTSSARSGKLIVKEYANEHFAHVGLFLDTELQRFEKHRCFESRVSLIGGMAKILIDHHYLPHLFTTDPRIKTTQSKEDPHDLNHLLVTLSSIEGQEKIDLVLAAKRIKEQAHSLTAMIVVLKNFDKQRAAFINELHACGLPIKILIIHSNPLLLTDIDASIQVFTPDQLIPL